MFLAAASSLSETMSIDPDLTNLRPGSDAYTELQMLATIFSALACGVVLSLSVSCFQLVYQRFHKKSDSASKRMHRFLLAYITFMTCTSVVYLALDITSTRNSIFTDGPHVDLFLPGGSRAICVAFASWGADGFMVRILATIWSLLLPITRQVWRLVRLYGDLSGHRRAWFIALLVALSFSSLGGHVSSCF